eukprot:TRINITY_DN13726_c0_g1_i1.p1 TRINITY_DN13726_c0_g1~~TRINITY_DN13726_c0_g1_i1.p1  ORF type:complete len:184 (+),score=24.82 TRINITY_DN13726_c0_g1_i1:60-554(+)
MCIRDRFFCLLLMTEPQSDPIKVVCKGVMLVLNMGLVVHIIISLRNETKAKLEEAMKALGVNEGRVSEIAQNILRTITFGRFKRNVDDNDEEDDDKKEDYKEKNQYSAGHSAGPMSRNGESKLEIEMTTEKILYVRDLNLTPMQNSHYVLNTLCISHLCAWMTC